MTDLVTISFDNSFFRDMAGFYVAQSAAEAPKPALLAFNRGLAVRLGILVADEAELAQTFSGNALPHGAQPLAQVYAGHQFGGFSPRLGDGRALLIGEVVAPDGQRFDLQLKGSGRTPFSRGGDGLAAVGPVLREYLVSEAMHALGVPTTRALAAVATGGFLYREDVLPGAVLTRVAASHLRIGTFQYFAARGETEQVRRLVDYAMRRHAPELAADDALGFYRAVIAAQARLVARWMQIGFIHGVMNTDNMSISGETIDYGPCAFMDAYHPQQVFSSIDEAGRYAFSNQPLIAQWNLARLGETLIGLVAEDEAEAITLLTEAVESFPALYEQHWLDGMRSKLGLSGSGAGDEALVRDLLALMARQEADFTLTFRRLSEVVRGDAAPFLGVVGATGQASDWLDRYRHRQSAEREAPEVRAVAMDRVNPLLIPRNHLVEAAVNDGQRGDLARFHALSEVLADPYTERPGVDAFLTPDPGYSKHFRTFCGT